MMAFNKNESKYENLTKEELIEILKFRDEKEIKHPATHQNKNKRQFDWSSASKRHVLLKFMYFGWDYHGYAAQDCTEDTIESHLFEALKRCCLIENRESSNYHRCGRTDREVSAFSQVISIDLRSKHKTPDENNVNSELPYCKMLNRLLPLYIRAYAWCPVGSEVSARFDCTERSYFYYFPRGLLNISAMAEAAKYLEGTHDFRNLCKMDVGNGVTNFVRTINKAEIKPFLIEESPTTSSGFQMMKLVIVSRGFLWHQIRCIMAVLLLVGEGSEDPSIITKLLDITQNPCKPQYHMASPVPLTLATAEYEDLKLIWNFEEEEMEVLVGQLQGLFTEFSVKASMVREALHMLGSLSNTAKSWKRQVGLYTGTVSKVHVPLLSRPTCPLILYKGLEHATNICANLRPPHFFLTVSLDERVKNTEKRKERSNAADESNKRPKVE